MFTKTFGRENDGNNDRKFVHGKELSMLGNIMVKERFEKYMWIEIKK